MDDFARLAAHGMTGADAESALCEMYRRLMSIGKRISDFDGWESMRLMRLFGSDAGRAAVILTRQPSPPITTRST